MKILFGKKMCSECQKIKKEYDEKGVKYIYHDLDTTDGLASAAYEEVLKDNMVLPIIIEGD